MNKLAERLKKLRLSLMFAMIVFVVLVVTVLLVFAGMFLLSHFGILDADELDRVPLFMFAVVSVIVGTVLSIIFSRRPLAPLNELISAADRIADGDYSIRLELKGTEEFRELGRKFNHMAEELGSVELLRNDFVNNFSHEFKTPIVSIRGFAKALKWGNISDEERDEYLDIIISESERLSELSSNVLYLSGLEQQTILTGRIRFNLSEQIRLVAALLDKKLNEKRLTLDFECGEIFLVGNEEMLRQVWINLLDNAIKFSLEGGRIGIDIRQDTGHTLISVSNQGNRIPFETAAHIFDKFYQGDASHTTHGNGLGLAIVKRIVELHNGTVCLRQDGGITFEVRI